MFVLPSVEWNERFFCGCLSRVASFRMPPHARAAHRFFGARLGGEGGRRRYAVLRRIRGPLSPRRFAQERLLMQFAGYPWLKSVCYLDSVSRPLVFVLAWAFPWPRSPCSLAYSYYWVVFLFLAGPLVPFAARDAILFVTFRSLSSLLARCPASPRPLFRLADSLTGILFLKHVLSYRSLFLSDRVFPFFALACGTGVNILSAFVDNEVFRLPRWLLDGCSPVSLPLLHSAPLASSLFLHT